MTVMMDVIEDGDDLPIARVLSPDLTMRARLVERIEAIDEWLIDAYALGMVQSPSAAQAQGMRNAFEEVLRLLSPSP
jgi:hypothetical protein